MATIRNVVPAFFNISKEHISLNPASCIWGMDRAYTLLNTENNTLNHIFSSYEFEILEDKLVIFKPKDNNFRKKIAELKQGDYVRE
jgi:hypothetical protein